MKALHRFTLFAAATITLLLPLSTAAQSSTQALRVLLVSGGCCHDYANQHRILSEGIQARAKVQVDVWWTDDKSVNPPLSLYEKEDWAAGYDLVIHDECAAGNQDREVVKRLLATHETIPAVHLHCAMHSFRNGTDLWFKHLGLQSSSHGPLAPIAIDFVDKTHPITKALENWTTINEELYNNVEVFGAHPLAIGKQRVKRDDKETEAVAIVAWTNERQGIRSFSTSLGHTNETVADPRYLDLVTRGLLWACDKLETPDYLGTPFTGNNEITFVKAKPTPPPAPVKAPQASDAPTDATLVTVTASSEETGKNNLVWHAVDGHRGTRWCASDGSTPQWIQLEFETPETITNASIIWESDSNAYRYKIEGSKDGSQWTVLTDASDNQKLGNTEVEIHGEALRFLKITCSGTSAGGWASIREIQLRGPKLKSLFPKVEAKQTKASHQSSYDDGGNIPPKIVKLSQEEEQEILKDVKVPEGFDLSLFSNWQAANYPVYVAAAPNGDLYVSSDGNGSLGRDPKRGRVLRLRDTDGDGRADEVTEFVKEVDSPRGLIWDHDRLYLLHPPHISAYYDRDGDGVAEESEILIDGIAFGFEDRPADHTTNGLELGIDGWIYIAGGDFGFMKATGSDGRTLQHRGGGVLRFRPDGSGLEIFATGTRNILGTPMSPTCDLFARDNTNDGDAWDVRFHHFTGLEDHGYPSLYKNFPKEHVHPLADYGGGSGCGSVYLHEPGIPDEWNRAPITCDWGRAASFHHKVQRIGASFEEVSEPRVFIGMTRPTDASVDGFSSVYQASWKGPATFKWNGPEMGYIVKVKPTGYQADPLPDFETMEDLALVAALESPSHVRTLAAQRSLLRREAGPSISDALLDLAINPSNDLKTRVAAMYTLVLREQMNRAALIEQLSRIAASSDEMLAYTIRASGDLDGAGESLSALLEAGLKSSDPRARLEAVVSIARLGLDEMATSIADLLDDEDPRLSHTAYRALVHLGSEAAYQAALVSIDRGSAGAALALMRIHDPKLVDILIDRLSAETHLDRRKLLLAILCRLTLQEGEWTGDSWGTRPDTRGPYYQAEPWSKSEDILTVLKSTLETATPEEASFLVKEMNRNRLRSDEALTRILSLAKENPSLVPVAVEQLVATETISADGRALLIEAARDPNIESLTLSQAITALSRIDGEEALAASLAGFSILSQRLESLRETMQTARDHPDPVKATSDWKYARTAFQAAETDLTRTAKTFLEAPKLENHHLALEQIAAATPDSDKGFWANAALLALASRTNGAPESRELSQKALDRAWNHPAQKVALIAAAAQTKNHYLNERILVALNDPDPLVAGTAKAAAKDLKLQAKGKDQTPKIASLGTEQALAAVLAHQGGEVALGEAIFARATCSACHTVSQSEKPKGPYLGNIVETYQRADLALNILDPNNTIAQGFATNVLTLKDGNIAMGFVTDELGDRVTLRDLAAQEHTFAKSEISKRETLPTSMMPAGLMDPFTVHEMASLLDYLASLVKK